MKQPETVASKACPMPTISANWLRHRKAKASRGWVNASDGQAKAASLLIRAADTAQIHWRAAGDRGTLHRLLQTTPTPSMTPMSTPGAAPEAIPSHSNLP
jgi:hypothetical protein